MANKTCRGNGRFSVSIFVFISCLYQGVISCILLKWEPRQLFSLFSILTTFDCKRVVLAASAFIPIHIKICSVLVLLRAFTFQFKFEFLDTTMFRLCRAARIIKLLRTGTSIRLMLWTFLQSFKVGASTQLRVVQVTGAIMCDEYLIIHSNNLHDLISFY